MKTIQTGIRYDTEKAELIGEASAGNYPGDGNFSSWRAGLYVTPRARRYFLAGEGGGLTEYATHHHDRSRSGGERIIPLSREAALYWAEEHLDPDDFEAHFADIIEEA